MKDMDDENKRLKKMYAEAQMQNDVLKEALGKKWEAIPTQRDGLVAVQHRKLSVVSACRTFSIGETCYRYKPKLSDENELIADWLLALTKAKKSWSLGLCYLHLRNVRGFGWNH